MKEVFLALSLMCGPLVDADYPTPEEIAVAASYAGVKTLPKVIMVMPPCGMAAPNHLGEYWWLGPRKGELLLRADWRQPAGEKDSWGLTVLVHELRHHEQTERGERRNVECDASMTAANYARKNGLRAALVGQLEYGIPFCTNLAMYGEER